jgi:hypothetical protein
MNAANQITGDRVLNHRVNPVDRAYAEAILWHLENFDEPDSRGVIHAGQMRRIYTRIQSEQQSGVFA